MNLADYPLFDRFPRLAEKLPVAGLLQGPTPLQPLAGAQNVWLKRDDLTAADYGGNKIRKLDFLLAGAQARGAKELVTFGYAGSNFVAATAWHGRKLGLNTSAFLLPQVNAAYVADNLSVSLRAGARLHTGGSTAMVAAKAAGASAAHLLCSGRWPLWIPPGGSSPVGVAGFINAALELHQQIDSGQAPAPESIYVAFSSMGTVAGLALGLELAGLDTRIVAVQVVDERFASAGKLDALTRDSARFMKKLDASFSATGKNLTERVQIRREFFGEEYGRPTPATTAAVQRFSAATGARADSAYSGKALACLYHDLDAGLLAGKPTLFWHTFNAHGLPQGVQRAAREAVTAELQDYF